jgi:hypothetical protein
VYKHALGHRRTSDERNVPEELRANLEAAGIDPLDTKFLDDVICRLEIYRKKKMRNPIELARELNRAGVRNAKGGQWTAKMIKLVVWQAEKSKLLPHSN